MIRKKPALGLDPGVDTGFPKRSCSTNKFIIAVWAAEELASALAPSVLLAD
jgi:hypothetical protein